MKRLVSLAMSIAASLILIIALLFSALQLVANDGDWFYKQYREMGTGSAMGMTDDAVAKALTRLVDYMEGRRDSIYLEVEVNGEKVEMFNERETAHMVDVQRLYLTWRTVRNVGLAISLLLFVGAAMLSKKGGLKTAARGFLWAAALFALVCAAAGAWVAIDFSSFWTSFHHLFFDNDLWILDPATSRMINMCPQSLFMNVIIRFGALFLGVLAALTIASALCVRKRRKKGVR